MAAFFVPILKQKPSILIAYLLINNAIMELTPESQLKPYFAENGYVVIDTNLDHGLFEHITASLAPYFGEDREIPPRVPFSDYNRIQDAWYINKAVWKVAASKRVRSVLTHLYDQSPRAFQTLNFKYGTQQPTHADTIHFNSEPFGSMCGVWVAFEDIGPDQGPLRIYPGSNALPEMNYTDFGLVSDTKEYPKYLTALESVIEQNGFKERHATIKKGQAVIWAANTLHGGAPQNDLSLTRHSQVTHFYMGDPKTWRPSFSKNGRAYFNPDRVRNMNGMKHRLYCYKETVKKKLFPNWVDH